MGISRIRGDAAGESGMLIMPLAVRVRNASYGGN